jgi:hypothetical protein
MEVFLIVDEEKKKLIKSIQELENTIKLLEEYRFMIHTLQLYVQASIENGWIPPIDYWVVFYNLFGSASEFT